MKGRNCLFVLLAGLASLSCVFGFNQNSKAVPTYSRDIAPILNKRCISCHSESQVAPFSLTTYEDARNHALTVAKVTQTGYMPPWKAKANYGEFRDVPCLSAEEKALIGSWAKAGAPEGDRSLTPKPPKVSPGWRLGKPSLVVSPEKSTNIPAEGSDYFRDYLVDPKITKPTWVRAIDFRPKLRGTVHHVVPSLVSKEEAEKCRKIKFDFDDNSWKQKSVRGIELGNVLGFWSTGAPPFESPAGTAFLIKPGDCIMLDIHYKTTGKSEVEQAEVALYFQEEAPKLEMEIDTIGSEDVYLQPGEPETRVYAIGPKLQHETTIYAVWPHMHYLGRTMKAWAKFPAGYSKPIIAVEDWDPEWQMLYYLKEPLVLPKGSKIYVTATYDNSAKNPRNPNSPPQVVEAGESSKDEMLLFELFQTVKKPPAEKK